MKMLKMVFLFSLEILSLVVLVVTATEGWNPDKPWVAWMLRSAYYWPIISVSILCLIGSYFSIKKIL